MHIESSLAEIEPPPQVHVEAQLIASLRAARRADCRALSDPSPKFRSCI